MELDNSNEFTVDDGLGEYEDVQDWQMIITINSYDEYEEEGHFGQDYDFHNYSANLHSIRINELSDYPNHLEYSDLEEGF